MKGPMMTKMTRTWSAQQNAVFIAFLDGTNNIVVRARAGTGKTTTIEEAVKRWLNVNYGQNITVCAFGKDIQVELAKRFAGMPVTVKTLHAIGLAQVKRYWPDVLVADFKAGPVRENDLAERVCGPTAPDPIKKLVAKLCTKGRLCAPHARKVGDLTDIMFAFECDPDDQWAEDGYDQNYVEAMALAAMELAATQKPVKTGIDGTDMLFLPVRNGWLKRTENMVVVDEAQDMNACQLEIAQGICKRADDGGRLVVVGDDRQAIFGFAGADSGSLDRLKAAYDAQELPLNTTYRCGKTIVEVAQGYVADFMAGPENPDGLVDYLSGDKLTAAAGPGDFVLSRVNAPLVSVAMSLLRAGKRTKIAGRDIGRGLTTLVRKLRGNSVPDFLRKVEAWKDRETQRLDSKFRGRQDSATYQGRLEGIRDQAEMLSSLADGARNVDEIVARIEALFTDDGLGDAGLIVCSSIHKAKGREAGRVFILKDTLRPGTNVEEDNICYVAVTRAKHTLTFVTRAEAAC